MRWVKAVALLLVMLGKVSFLIVPKYYFMRKIGISAFKKELCRMGIHKEAADALSVYYKDLGDVRTIAKEWKVR